MSIVKAFARGFAEGWRKSFASGSWSVRIESIISGAITILIWEWLNGRLFT